MTVRLAQINRHPIKSHGRERLSGVTLAVDQALPWDRHWAVAHEAAKLVPGWNECANFARGAKAPGLMSISARLNEESGRVTLTAPGKSDLTFHPDLTADLPMFLDWVLDLNPADRAQPVQIVTAGRGMTDTDYASVSILNLASNTALGAEMGVDLAPERWRANLWLDGLPPWAERAWLGRQVQIGEAVLQVTEHIVRCRATMANPATGLIDADTLTALNTGHGHQEMGLYARVVQGGVIAQSDAVVVL
jgi:uncharacterized protein